MVIFLNLLARIFLVPFTFLVDKKGKEVHQSRILTLNSHKCFEILSCELLNLRLAQLNTGLSLQDLLFCTVRSDARISSSLFRPSQRESFCVPIHFLRAKLLSFS